MLAEAVRPVTIGLPEGLVSEFLVGSLRLKPRGDAFQPPRRKAETVRIADGLQLVGKRHTRQTERERRHA